MAGPVNDALNWVSKLLVLTHLARNVARVLSVAHTRSVNLVRPSNNNKTYNKVIFKEGLRWRIEGGRIAFDLTTVADMMQATSSAGWYNVDHRSWAVAATHYGQQHQQQQHHHQPTAYRQYWEQQQHPENPAAKMLGYDQQFLLRHDAAPAASSNSTANTSDISAPPSSTGNTFTTPCSPATPPPSMPVAPPTSVPSQSLLPAQQHVTMLQNRVREHQQRMMMLQQQAHQGKQAADASSFTNTTTHHDQQPAWTSITTSEPWPCFV